MKVCAFRNVCKKLFNVDELCYLVNKQKSSCELVNYIQKGVLDKKVLRSLDKINSGAVVKKKEGLGIITCPRSTVNNLTLTSPCPLKKCPYYSKKMSYNCYLIHHTIFFSDYKYIPPKVLEIGQGVTRPALTKASDIGIYLLRAGMLLFKYHNESYLSKKEHKMMIIKGSRHSVCPVCSNVMFQQDTSFKPCSCYLNDKLRNRRVRFALRWNKVLQSSRNTIKKTRKAKLGLTPKNIHALIQEHGKLMVIRALLALVKNREVELPTNTDGVPLLFTEMRGGQEYFIDVPFGFIFVMFHILFVDREWKMCENLGLTNKTYNIAWDLFGESLQDEPAEEG